jgi:hypothetical protein
MNIKIVAILEESGRAFIREGNALYHIKPPYNLASKSIVLEKELELAINGYGFVSSEITFDSYFQIEKYLFEKYQAFRAKSTAIEMQDYDLLRKVPQPFIKIYVKRLKQKFSEGKFAFVINFAKDLLLNKYIDNSEGAIDILNEIIAESQSAIDEEIGLRTKHIFVNVYNDPEFKSDYKYNKLAPQIELCF